MAATAVHVRSPGPARARRLPRVGDDRLVARVRAGDDAAFEIIFDRYYAGLLAFCGHMLGSRQEAEDALQHSFASAYRALRGGAGDIELRPWLYTIARNRCLSALRAQRAQVSADGLAAESGPFEGMSAQVQLRADLRELVDELQRLPDDQRAALVLFELGDESHAQIAAVLGVRREKVKALVFQAREALMRARDGARDSVRRDPRAARHRHRPGPAAQHGAPAHRPLPRLRGVRARGSPPARRARGHPAAGADRRPEGLGPGLRASAAAAPSRWAARARAAAPRSPPAARSRPAGWAAAESRAAPARPLRALSAPRAQRAWPRAWPPGAAEWGSRACRPRASWRRSCPSWPWAAAARRRRSTATGCRGPPAIHRARVARRHRAGACPPIRRRPGGACRRAHAATGQATRPTRPPRRPRPRGAARIVVAVHADGRARARDARPRRAVLFVAVVERDAARDSDHRGPERSARGHARALRRGAGQRARRRLVDDTVHRRDHHHQPDTGAGPRARTGSGPSPSTPAPATAPPEDRHGHGGHRRPGGGRRRRQRLGSRRRLLLIDRTGRRAADGWRRAPSGAARSKFT